VFFEIYFQSQAWEIIPQTLTLKYILPYPRPSRCGLGVIPKPIVAWRVYEAPIPFFHFPGTLDMLRV
jgi:hypothetical protein